jgi:hypothetical protein
VSGRRRVLVAVEPRVLGDVLARLLRHDHVDVDALAVDGGEVEPPAAGHYDAAVVTITLPDSVTADVVLELPDTLGNAGEGRLRQDAATTPVPVDGPAAIIDLIDGP